ncbi:hypothetical protein [Microbulbifer rhizosphaerae]|uniref:Uncharacterized protein n=1 Tax=Microbulbifer rhizosphaerae TaxID=1562603 RepID=A0A7W4WAZ4_9GAMM|nr:hypothetical protein [Microbulbifer rhizosphaerae]MBB3060261.1 hypothetical protein [Microbulbifer rhizosphaerae]
MFVNSEEFNEPTSRQWAMGADTRPKNALVDGRGRVLAYSQTGGMISPARHELHRGTILYRFASGSAELSKAVTGGWWVAKAEFEQLTRFAQAHGVHVAMAARHLCCVPPEWSDMGLLMRVQVQDPLLAYRGLGNRVVVPKDDGYGAVRMEPHNNLASRRLHQLFIPGLQERADRTPERVLPGALLVERTWKLDSADTNRGWIYVPGLFDKQD